MDKIRFIDQSPQVLRQPSRDPPTHSMLPRAQLSKETTRLFPKKETLSTKKETLSTKKETLSTKKETLSTKKETLST